VVPGEDWLYPYLIYLIILCILAVMILLTFITDTRTQLLVALLSFGGVLAAYALRRHYGSRARAPSGELVREP
jgi:L-asparagine transporter-like permease